MRYDILLSPEAIVDLRQLKVSDLSGVKHAIETHLRHEPLKVSKSRIKRLRGIHHPGYRLRVGKIRVFYDVAESRVEVLAIVPKSKAADWLKRIEEGQ